MMKADLRVNSGGCRSRSKRYVKDLVKMSSVVLVLKDEISGNRL